MPYDTKSSTVASQPNGDAKAGPKYEQEDYTITSSDDVTFRLQGFYVAAARYAMNRVRSTERHTHAAARCCGLLSRSGAAPLQESLILHSMITSSKTPERCAHFLTSSPAVKSLHARSRPAAPTSYLESSCTSHANSTVQHSSLCWRIASGCTCTNEKMGRRAVKQKNYSRPQLSSIWPIAASGFWET
jgi:hypothetical protein